MDRGTRLGRISVLFCLLILTAAGTPAEETRATLEPPSLRIDRDGAVSRITVETQLPGGGIAHSLLRETSASVEPRRTGRDPVGRAAFATWDESGQRWFAVSRDGGATWAEARQLKLDLRLRDGAVVPGVAMPAPRQGYAAGLDGRLFVVQFRTVGLPEWRQALQDVGADVLNYLPHNAHIVRMSPTLVPLARTLDFVERVEAYHPWYRLDAGLRAWLDAEETTPAETLRVRVMAFEWGEQGKARIADAARGLGATVAENFSSGHVIELNVTRDQLRSIAAHDEVLWIDPWSPRETDMDIVRQDAGTDWVENNHGYCGDTGVRGEVLDSGIQADHMDFDGLILHGGNSQSSHGTSTFGIVFGNGNRDGDGQAQGTGHMPCAGAQGIFADYDFLGDRFLHTQELKADPYFASFQTNSWGNAQVPNYNSFSSDMDDIIWRLDIAILQSQSNTGNQNSRPQAWAKNIISVGGIRHKNTLSTVDDDWTGGASIGPAEDGRIKPDVNYWYDSIYTTTTGNGYTSGFGGTSAATPESAGVLGLMVEMWADNVWQTDPVGSTVFDKQPRFSTIKALLINNSKQYDFTGQGHDLTRVHQGWGRPSAQVAYERAANSFVVDEEVLLELNDFSIFDVDVQAGETELKITMIYPDPPGTTSASMHRINDVNLKATSPSGTIYHGNVGLLDGTESTPGGAPNSIDTVENIFIKNPEAGSWQVEIEAVEINQDGHLDTPDDDVAYALVITGGTSTLIQPSDGRVRMDDDAYGCAHTIGLRVIDGNVGASTVTVDVRSDTETTPETLTLTETKPGSGKYAGTLVTTSAAPTPGDGEISIVHADVITVDYVDADDGMGGVNILRTDTSTADCQQPIIGSVGETNITDVSASVVWTTDELADGEIIWGPTIPPTTSATEFGKQTSHQVDISGLQSCTVYYYEVHSVDRHGNAAVDDNGGNYYHFETQGDFGNGLQPCHAGQVSVGTGIYSCSDVVTMEVVDLDLNPDPLVAETVMLTISSTTETDPETVLATETGPNTSVFSALISTASGPPVSDGVLQVAHGDVITVTYRDADDGSGSPALSFASAVADCGGPAISNLRVDTISDQRASIRWDTAESADTVVEWGPTPALGNVESSSSLVTSHAVTMNQFDSCQSFYFRVQSTDVYGNTTVVDNAGQPFSFHTFDIPGLYHHDDFESGAPGWTLNGEWETGAPQGIGGSSGAADPSSAYNNTGVLGHDLNGQGTYAGDYEPLSSESAFSPVLDGSAWTNTRLIFYRDLTTGSSDVASLWLFTDGVGRPLFNTTGSSQSDNGYQTIELDIGVFADGASTVQVEFRQEADAAGQYSGWNLDDLIFKDGSLPNYAACQDCGAAPSFAGATSATDNDACGASGVTVSWDDPVAWGSGDGGTFAVYRDTTPGFTPSAANRIAAGVATLSYNDVSAPTDQTLYYLVRAESDETCGSGPNNGGLLDANQAYVSVSETTTSPTPGEVQGVLAEMINFAHLRLSWNAATGATSYRVYRSESPDTGFLLLTETSELSFDDLDQGGNANSYFYKVVGRNACGVEGP
jgi:hypothetical protein